MTKKPDPDGVERVLVCGGGPVGLLLANLLGRAGVPCTVIERTARRPDQSMAIGITPPSLAILRQVGLDGDFAQRGLRIQRAVVHENGTILGELSFAHLPGDHRYILSLPQRDGIEILEEGLRRFPHVSVKRSCELAGFRQGPHGATAFVRSADEARSLRGAFLIGCDGHRSRVRAGAGLEAPSRAYPPRFVMADFEDRSGLGDVAHLFFGRRRPVESFPLPGGVRRWIAMVNDREWEADPIELLKAEVRRETGVDLSGAAHSAPSRFRPSRMLAPAYHRGRVVLCGDAAHVMSPIGGQGMNTGFADADLLARALTRVMRHGEAAEPLLRDYTRLRTAAFRVAAGRAARGMWLGTRRGAAGSLFRRVVVRHVLFLDPVRRALPPYFAMMDLPGHGLEPARSGA